MINKIEISDIPGRKCNFNNAIEQEIRDFHGSDWDACEVDIGKYKTAHSATAAYRNAITRMRVNVIAIERGGRLFLVRGDK